MAKEYDIVLYGATGFTGKLATSYLASQYGATIKWAIAGRNKDKLDALAKSRGGGHCGVIVADSGDYPSLQAMCAVAKVIATTAGPFARYGSGVVQACAESGTDYCDITGETDWVRDMIAKHDDTARKTGARIVNLCGHDSIPWDLSTYMLAEKLKESGEELTRVDFYDKIKGGVSGGTLETAMHHLFGGKKEVSPERKAMGFDPLMKLPSGDKSKHSTKLSNVVALEMPKAKGLPYRANFVMAGVNGGTVRRSNAINGYGLKVVYSEGMEFKGLFATCVYMFGLILFGLGLFIPPTRYLLRAYVLPKPGEGPAEENMDDGYLRVTGHATGSKGTVISSTFGLSVDPGYKDTARMLVESALSLALQGDDCGGGGIFTPASCQKKVLLGRLQSQGPNPATFAFK